MIELELLGVEPDSGKLSLNDPEGNRYSLAITDELLAALRRDVPEPVTEPKPITPREIQAMFRAGKSVDEVAQISALPASALLALEHPITAERQYTANQARSYRQAHELGGLTIDELVISRLIDRGVTADGVTWDAYREAGSPWTLSARYTVADEQVTALWRINSKNQSVTALNDEATWLTETAVPVPSSPWRAHNTPRVTPHSSPTFDRKGSTDGITELYTTRSPHLSAFPPASPAPLPAMSTSHTDTYRFSQTATHDKDLESDMHDDNEEAQDIDIESVLASLDSQRGQIQAMPDDDFFDNDNDASTDSPSGSSARRSEYSDTFTLAKNSDKDSDACSGSHGDTAGTDEQPEKDEPQGATILELPSPSRTPQTDSTHTADADLHADSCDDQGDTPQENQQQLPGLSLAPDAPSSNADAESNDTTKTDSTGDASAVSSDEPSQKAPQKNKQKSASKKKRRDRPTMPSWDEIVFGYSKDDHE